MKPRNPTKLADQIGLTYEAGTQLAKDADQKKAQARAELNALIQKLGLSDQDRAYVEGTIFRVGFFTRTAASKFDEELFAKLYPKDHARCLVTKTVFDYEVLKKLVAQKKIDKKKVLTATVKGQKSTTIDIKRK